MAETSGNVDRDPGPLTIAVALPEWAMIAAGIALDPHVRSKVLTEALETFLKGDAAMVKTYDPDPLSYRRTVEVDLPGGLLARLDEQIAGTAWRPRAHAIEQALVAHLGPPPPRTRC